MTDFNLSSTTTDVIAAYGGHAIDKTYIITGPSEGGLGAETALALAGAGAGTVVLAGRDESKIAPVIAAMRKKSPQITALFVHLDLTDNESVRQAAETVNSRVTRVDVLVNNAGIAGQRKYEKSASGIEKHFAANYLGHFLFTNLVLDRIIAAHGSIINITSMAYTLAEINVKDINFEDGTTYNGWFAYARSKTANILFTFALGEKLHDKVAVFAVDPGMAHNTNLLSNSGVDDAWMAEGHRLAVERNGGKPPPTPPLVSSQQACASTLLVVLNPSLRNHAPAFVKECAITPTLPYASDPEAAKDLWAVSEKLVDEKFR